MSSATRRSSEHTDVDRGGGAPPAAAPAPVAAHAVLGNRVARTVLAQPKLMVGASDDPLEAEADRVAAEVARSVVSGAAGAAPSAHDCGPDCDHGGVSRRSAHECGPGCGHPIPAISRVLRRADPADAGIGAAGGEALAADESEVQRARGGGSTLPEAFRTRAEAAMGADFSAVRVHTGDGAARLNRSFGASAFTVGNDIFMRDGLPDLASARGAHLMAHELTHTIQQGGAPLLASRCSCLRTGERVQRHSSFEHLMLGNVKPRDLAKVGAWQNAIEQTTPDRSTAKKIPLIGKKISSGEGLDSAQVNVDLGGGNVLQIVKSDILHVLLNEMIRLRKWQRQTPKKASAERADPGAGEAMGAVAIDPEFGVYTLELPGGIICTYGEMNTLGDYFGSFEVMKRAAADNPDRVRELLQSVRDETFTFLAETHDKVAESLTKQEKDDQSVELQQHSDRIRTELLEPELADGMTMSFSGATTFRISGMGGQLTLLLGGQKTGASGKTNDYGASLGRNACHFVPESWHAWAENHKKARVAARDARAATLAANAAKTIVDDPQSDPQAKEQQRVVLEEKKGEAVERANEAMMQNGFGDHFLQDSYAAGHMINKTQIMQLYIEYIDKNKEWDYFKDENWRKVQNIAYGQNLSPTGQYDQDRIEGRNGATGANANRAMDPQSVENRQNTTWIGNFQQLGLKVPRSLQDPASNERRVLALFQQWARAGTTSATGADITGSPLGGQLNPLELRMATAELVADGVLLADVDVSKRGTQMAEMRDKREAVDTKRAGNQPVLQNEGAGEALPLAAFRKGKFRLRKELMPAKGDPADTRTEQQLQRSFQAITYNDYLEFITSAFLQKATNAMHDVFCKGGLTVYDRADNEIGRVYGDDAMFNQNSSFGVAHSGTTAQMSRDAIVNIANGGPDISEQAIVDRFPRKVRADTYDKKGNITPGQMMPIEDWHNAKNGAGLRQAAFTYIFPDMSWSLTQKLVVGGKGELGGDRKAVNGGDPKTLFFTAPPPHKPF